MSGQCHSRILIEPALQVTLYVIVVPRLARPGLTSARTESIARMSYTPIARTVMCIQFLTGKTNRLPNATPTLSELATVNQMNSRRPTRNLKLWRYTSASIAVVTRQASRNVATQVIGLKVPQLSGPIYRVPGKNSHMIPAIGTRGTPAGADTVLATTVAIAALRTGSANSQRTMKNSINKPRPMVHHVKSRVSRYSAGQIISALAGAAATRSEATRSTGVPCAICT
jgi:hypothetical protein